MPKRGPRGSKAFSQALNTQHLLFILHFKKQHWIWGQTFLLLSAFAFCSFSISCYCPNSIKIHNWIFYHFCWVLYQVTQSSSGFTWSFTFFLCMNSSLCNFFLSESSQVINCFILFMKAFFVSEKENIKRIYVNALGFHNNVAKSFGQTKFSTITMNAAQ